MHNFNINIELMDSFVKNYYEYMDIYDDPCLINPFGKGILHNVRPWEHWQITKEGEWKPSDKVLDAGAMHTFFCLYIAQFVSSIDVTDSFYWAKRAYHKEQGLLSVENWSAFIESKCCNLKVSDADIQDLYFDDNSFDKIICVSTMEHVIEDIQGMNEFSRVLKPGGLLLLTVEYNHFEAKEYSEQDGSWFRLYSEATLPTLLDIKGLATEKIEFDNPDGRGNAFIKMRKI